MGFVFQDSVLLPWKNVRQNAEFPLVIQKKQTEENEKKLDELLELAGLSEFKTALPRELSGGMKQRVSIVRALSYDAPLLLMDEPYGQMDIKMRFYLENEVIRLWQALGSTVIFITHNVEEAVYLADRIIVLTPKPCSVREIVTVDLPRPRNVSDDEFIKIRSHVTDAIKWW